MGKVNAMREEAIEEVCDDYARNRKHVTDPDAFHAGAVSQLSRLGVPIDEADDMLDAAVSHEHYMKSPNPMGSLQQHIADICATAAGVKVKPRETADVISLASYSASNQPTEDEKHLADVALKNFIDDFAKLNESAHALSVDAAKAGQKDVSDTVGMILLDFMFIEARLEKLGGKS